MPWSWGRQRPQQIVCPICQSTRALKHIGGNEPGWWCETCDTHGTVSKSGEPLTSSQAIGEILVESPNADKIVDVVMDAMFDEALGRLRKRGPTEGWPIPIMGYLAALNAVNQILAPGATEFVPEVAAACRPAMAGWAWRLCEQVYGQPESLRYVGDGVAEQLRENPNSRALDVLVDFVTLYFRTPNAASLGQVCGSFDDQRLRIAAAATQKMVGMEGLRFDTYFDVFRQGLLSCVIWQELMRLGAPSGEDTHGIGLLRLRAGEQAVELPS